MVDFDRTGEILVIGDSKSSNYQGAVESWPELLRRMLGAEEGFVQADNGVMDPRWTVTHMRLARIRQVGLRPDLTEAGEKKSARFTSTEPFTGGILRVRVPGGGSVMVAVDGEVRTVAIGGSAGFQAINLGALDETAHTVEVSSTGNLHVAGITLAYPTPRLRVSNPARPSSAASDWSMTAAGGRWATVLDATDPGLVICALGSNEAEGLAALTQFYNQVADLDIAVVVVSPGAIDRSRGRTVTNALTNHLYGIAEAHGWVLVDFERVVGDTDAAVAAGLMHDKLHEGSRGMALEAHAVMQLLVAPGRRPRSTDTGCG